MKMRVLMVSTYPPSNDAIADYTHRLVNYLLRAACRVDVVAPKIAKRGKLVWESGLRVHESNSSSTLPFSVIHETLTESPVIVHVQHEIFLYGSWFSNFSIIATIIALKVLRRKVIVTLHHVLAPNEIKDARTLFNVRVPYVVIRLGLSLFYSIVGKTDGVVVASPTFKTSLVRWYRFNPDNIHVINHAVDLDELRRVKLLDQNIDAHGSLNLLFYGYLRPGKGVEVLVRAVNLLSSRIPDLKLVILYKIQMKYLFYLRHVEDLIRELGLSGRVSLINAGHNEGLNYIISSDVAVFPFTSTVGTTSWSYIRIALYRKPLIVTKILADAAGLRDGDEVQVVEPGEHDQLASAIEKLANDKDRSLQMATALYQKLENYDWTANAGRHLKLYTDIQKN